MRIIRNLRWWIVALICCGTILNYLARNSLAVLVPQLRHALGITTHQYSYIIGVFQFSYALMQPVCGFVMDHIGLQLGFASFAVVWSLANMAQALASDWMGLALFRGLMGMSEAALIPAGMKAITEWFPARERSIATGWFNSGTSIGSMLAPPLVIGISLASSWQMAFVATGAISLLWAAAWYLFYRSPERHGAISDEERTYITANRPHKPQLRAGALKIVSSSGFWTVAIPRSLIDPAWQTIIFWFPLYLAKDRGMDLAHIAMFGWLPFLAADIGGLFGGYISPFLVKRLGMNLMVSRITGISLGAGLMTASACIGLVSSPYAAISLICIAGFAHQMISVLHATLSADVFAPEEVGKAIGFVFQAGMLGAFVFSLVIGQLADRIGYPPLFACLPVFDLIAAAILFGSLRRLQVLSSGGH